jgi:glycosyltransferase involved in cell wall biosynthesis
MIGEELAAAYASCDVFSFPSKSETFGQVVLEAQASGLPVVAFRAEGVCDIIQDGRTGWLAEIGLPEEEAVNFERGILEALSNTDRRKNASVEATRWAMTWRWSEATEKCVDAYREAMRAAAVELV